MQIVRFEEYGGPEVLRVEHAPIPEPGPGQVRIRVRYVGVNAVDWKIRRGIFAPGESAPADPCGTGLEMSGDVDAVGPGAGLTVGAAVFGSVSSAAASHVVADADQVLAKPPWLSYEQSAALPIASETAYRALSLLGVKDGHALLIHAVAGGVGLVAAQLARAGGASVVGTASERQHEFLRGIGVAPVTYGEHWESRVRAIAPAGIDRVLDASGRGVLGPSVELTGDPDHVLTIADMTEAEKYGVRFSTGAVPLVEVFETVLPLVRDGRVHLPIEQICPLEQIAEAHRRSEAGHLRGKLLLGVSG